MKSAILNTKVVHCEKFKFLQGLKMILITV